MICPNCKSLDIWVRDSRPLPGTNGIRRRRHCKSCQHLWSTVELEAEKSTGQGRPLVPITGPLTSVTDVYFDLEKAVAEVNDRICKVKNSIDAASLNLSAMEATKDD